MTHTIDNTCGYTLAASGKQIPGFPHNVTDPYGLDLLVAYTD